jgi:predicted outer membrane repeat protein
MRRTRGKLVRSMAVLILTCHGFGHAAWGTVYVDVDAPGLRNGSSWQNAYRSLEDALNMAGPGEEVRVAQGTYKPQDAGPGYFHVTREIHLEGGYAGYGTSNPDARDIRKYETILSGDKKGNDYTVDELAVRSRACLLGTFTVHSDNVQVMRIESIGSGGLVDGFTISGGHGGADDYGGGLTLMYTAATVSHCTFEGNAAEVCGGAIYVHGTHAQGSPKITHSIFRLNSANMDGGAIRITASEPVISNCLFCQNYATQSGGAIYIQFTEISSTQPIHITNCTFDGNQRRLFSSAIHNGGSMLSVTNCILMDRCADPLGDTDLTYTCTIPGVGGTANGNMEATSALFVDQDGPDNVSGTRDDDFRLQSISPCIDAGNNAATGVSSTDLDGRARVVNGRVDMGAYEYGAGSSPPTQNVDLYDAGESYRSFSPLTFQAGQSGQMMEIKFAIGNQGTESAPPHKISFYVSVDTRIAASDYLITEEQIPYTISPGMLRSLTAYGFQFPTNVPPGTYYVGWIIDPSNEVAETDETNNTAYKEGYKCTVTGGTPPTDCCGLQPGDRVRLLVTNPNGAVNLPVGTLGTVMGCYQGEYTYAFVSWDNWSNGTTSCEQCSPPVWLPSPSGKSVLCSQIQPVGTSPPTTNVDLYDAGESYRSFSPRTFQAGQSGQMMEIYFRIGNKGTDVAPSHVIRFYASTDTRITASDYFIAEETLEPLSPNQTQGWRADNLEFPVNVPAGEYYIGWIIDPDNRIAETDETNNTAYKEGYRCTATGLPAGQPDLVDAGESYRSFTPRTVEAGMVGQTLTICSTVRNQGTGRAEACAARCYASQDIDITAADYLLCQQQVPALDPGGTYSFCCSSAFPTTIPAGVYYVGWIIDASYQVTESDESNNRAYKQGYQLTVTAPVAAQPDLHDQGESGCGFMPQTLEAGKPGQSLLIWSNVVNTGTAGANACKVRCYASQDTQITPADARLAEISLPALGAGTSLGIRASEAFPTTIAAGTYYVGWIIDADNQVPESNEDNNISYKQGYQLIVTAPSKPDLYDLGRTYQSVDPDPPIARIEDGIVTPASFRVRLKVGNQGTGKSEVCTLRCYASTDTAITAADTLLGQVEIPALAGGDSAELVIEAACPPGTAQGFYTIGWIIDADDRVAEKNETNNTGFLESPQLLVHYPKPI